MTSTGGYSSSLKKEELHAVANAYKKSVPRASSCSSARIREIYHAERLYIVAAGVMARSVLDVVLKRDSLV